MFRFRRQVYCDNNATTQVSKTVRKRMREVLAHCYANPSSPYKMAHQAAGILSDARERLAKAINAPPQTILFTSCATESNNTLRAIAPLLSDKRRAVLYNPLEHPAMLETLFHLREQGFSMIPLTPDRLGRIRPEEVGQSWREDVGLLVCMAANNETGTLYDIKRMAGIARAHGALFFCDMVQALGKIPVDVQDCGVDYASFSAHKIHGPKGVGALYIREGAPFAPFMLGGHQEEARRAGTEGLHNIAGFAAAADEIPHLLSMADELRLKRERFVAAIREMFPACVINSPAADECQPGTVSVTFPGTANAVVMGQLDYCGVSVAAGSACNTGEDAPSHVLTAMGLSREEARATLRISFPHALSDKDLRYVIAVFGEVLSGKGSRVTVLQPSQLTEEVLFAPDIFIIDLRRTPKSEYLLKPLPDSKQFPFFSIGKHLHEIPKNRPILVTCETGYDAPVVAYYLKRKGYTRLTFLMWGILGWKLAQPQLYARFARQHPGVEDDSTHTQPGKLS
ncbi:MAG: aminotransferase class V-fold PLP-dependent enzyme [Zoogloeaceae bacterium]|jgi:cysteine desulfurase|nr:aminotransferase class V-fold PLP-dependent enzyme [Zoogloeaceae bacterium]